LCCVVFCFVDKMSTELSIQEKRKSLFQNVKQKKKISGVTSSHCICSINISL